MLTVLKLLSRIIEQFIIDFYFILINPVIGPHIFGILSYISIKDNNKFHTQSFTK